MNQLFSTDNGIFQGLSKIMDCIYLSILFLISCIPVFTIGASLAALYYTVQKVIKNNRGYVGAEYWHAFRANFKQATTVWLITLVAGLILYTDVEILKAVDVAGYAWGKIYVFFWVLIALELLWCSYMFPYMARFSNGNKAIMKNAAFMAILNLPKTLLVALNLLFFGLIVYMMPITLIIVPALYTWMQRSILEKVFRKYMSEEDKTAEDEMNQDFKNE